MKKTWTAADVELGKLTMTLRGTVLHVERRYVFVDADQNKLTQIAGGRVVEEVELANIPKNILDALHKIDEWTYQKALEKEGM